MKPKLKVIAHTVTGTDCSDSEAKVLRLSGQFHIEADMLVAEASSKIVEFFKSEFLAASFYVKYDFHHLSIFRILHQKRLFIDIGELKTSGFLTYPLAYSRVMYDISADDPEKYYDYPYAIHKAVFTDQGVSQTVHFVDRDLDDCGMGCCGTGDGDYTATRLDDTLLKVRQLPGKTFYRYQEFTRNGEPVYYNPHVANANCTVEAEIRVYEDAWADMGDYSSFTTDSPLCLGLARIQSRAEAEVDCTVFFITVLEGSVSHAGIHFRVPVRILVDNTSQFTGITALIHDGGDMWILADVRDPLEDTTINEVGHNFSIPFYIARRGDVPPGIGYLNQEASHRASLYFKAYGTAIMFHFPGKINKKLLMFFLDWMTWGASKLYVYKLFYSNANDLVKSKFETTRNPEDRNTTTQSRFKWIQYIKIAKELVVIQNKKSQAMLRLERVFRETMVEIDTVFVE
ncbi:hypothetical protein ECANGB1_1373 [Enterospora canceri]|uniref:Uncharacterized protein n=1 Tax=Enterospora canceri TaxID=1081671 RepID=A0A1Y1S6Y3_9MICR|nr:hypothetical protein ECANGB1_1373 [Enterospora canceri]